MLQSLLCGTSTPQLKKAHHLLIVVQNVYLSVNFLILVLMIGTKFTDDEEYNETHFTVHYLIYNLGEPFVLLLSDL